MLLTKIIYFRMDSQTDLQTQVLLQYLSTLSECVQTIINAAPSQSTKKQKEAVHMFSILFVNCGSNHLQTNMSSHWNP